MTMQWETVIGLEIHAQLATGSKIFSGASTAFGAAPNTQACAVDLGLPGVLPVLNREAVKMAVKFGLAANAVVNHRSLFARKNYFYPDLPKGYQISQFELPVVGKGRVEILLDNGEHKTVGVTRAHLEEDAGKSLHEDFSGMTGIDLNRAGTALLEIVSEPDMRGAAEAVAYAKKIYAIVTYIGICDGNMAEGSFRMDANVSVRPLGQAEFGTRTEIKNLNSFRFLERAIHYEVRRQIGLIEDGGSVAQETRLYDAANNETRSMRSKEEANDYRYFPDPDLLPLVIADDVIDQARAELPELPDDKRRRFQSDHGLSAYDAGVLTATRELSDFFEAVLTASNAATDRGAIKLAANWVMGDYAAWLNKDGLTPAQAPVDAVMLGGLLKRITDNTISGKIAKTVFEALWAGEAEGIESDRAADTLISAKGLKQITDTAAIESIIDEILAANPGQLAQYRDGKQKLFGFFVGQTMKATQGKANPAQVNALLKKKLDG